MAKVEEVAKVEDWAKVTALAEMAEVASVLWLFEGPQPRPPWLDGPSAW